MQVVGVIQGMDTGAFPGSVSHTKPLLHSLIVIVCTMLLEKKYFDIEGVRVPFDLL